MSRTVIGLFDDRATARRVEEALGAADFPHERILIAATAPAHALAGEGIPVLEGSGDAEQVVSAPELVAILEDHGVARDKARLYTESISERGAAVIVPGLSDLAAESATRMLLEHRPTDPSRRLEALQEHGFGGYTAVASPFAEDDPAADRIPFADEHHGQRVAVVYVM
jgi:hypothetical protein